MATAPLPITNALAEEVLLAVKHPGAHNGPDLSYFQRLERAGADLQVAFAVLCNPHMAYSDTSRARVAQWLLTVPTVNPLLTPEFASCLRQARGQEFFEACLQGLAQRGVDAAAKRNVLHALLVDGGPPFGGLPSDAISSLALSFYALAPFPDVLKAWLQQPDATQAGATPAHLVWRAVREVVATYQGRLGDYPWLMSGALQTCTVEMARHGHATPSPMRPGTPSAS